jgi:uncharacterized protein YjbI with pentapeptide repeats
MLGYRSPLGIITGFPRKGQRMKRTIKHDKANFWSIRPEGIRNPLSELWRKKNHLKILRQGVAAWNEWREKNREIREPDLRGADLHGAMLHKANLFGAILYKSNLTEATLTEANLRGASLIGANLTKANLGGADLRWAQIIGTTLLDATLTGSYVYGAAVWDVEVNDGTKQQNLIITDRPRGHPLITVDNITDPDKPVITVDNIKVAQFIYLLLNNQEIRKVIDTITSKAVLILGRFSEKRKCVLDAIREELRKHDYLAIMFDFEAPINQTTIETVKTLAGMSRFVIVDLTDAKSVLQELQAIVPDFPSVAVRFLIKRSQYEPGMLDYIRRFPWVIEEAYKYEDEKDVIPSIKDHVIAPAEAKVRKLRKCD